MLPRYQSFRTLADGSYISVILKAVQFVQEGGAATPKKGKAPYDKLRVDFCMLPVEYGGNPVHVPLDVQTSNEQVRALVVDDDFYDDSAFDTPEARRAILDDFYDDSVFDCPSVRASLVG